MYISVQTHNSALIWTIHRPERMHALGPTIGRELLQLTQELKTQLKSWQDQDAIGEPSYRCLVLRAQPILRQNQKPIWIAGGDLKELTQLNEPREGRCYAFEWARIACLFQQLPIPVIVVMQGQVIGGATELALAADLRIATVESELHFKQLEVGLATGYGSCQRLVALLGLARATDLLLRCRKISAQEAHQLGLINELALDNAKLENLVENVCQQLSQISAKGLMVQKRMLQAPFAGQQIQLMEQELDLFESLWMGPPHQEFLKNFEKDKNS